ncbi:MAG: DUF58 domain-containing protein [Acidimicrobiales bacterium]
MIVEGTADHRLDAALIVAGSGLVTCLLTGRVELAALAAPFALIALVGVRGIANTPRVTASVLVEHERSVEGDVIAGVVELAVSGARRRVEVCLEHSDDLIPIEPATSLRWALRTSPHSTHSIAFALRARRWGAHHIGPLWVRVLGPFGIMRWTSIAVAPVTVRVLPEEATIRRELAPIRSGPALGIHPSRAKGEGLEYAGSRPFAVGDRLRNVNWRVSARRGDLWVDERHPDRNGDVIVFLDTFADTRDGERLGAKRAVLAAWAVASAQLRVRDRVGVVSFGGYPSWITPSTGVRARALILDRLLTADSSWNEVDRPLRIVPPSAIPARALVFVVTTLHDERIVGLVSQLRRRADTVAVLSIDTQDLLPPARRLSETVARTLWQLDRRRRLDAISAAGAAVATWPASAGVSEAIEALAIALRAVRRP